MAIPISYSDIVEEENMPKALGIISGTISKPHSLPGTPQVETEVSNLVIYTLPDDVTIIFRILADGGKDGEVCHEGWVRVGWQGEHRSPVKPHHVPLQE